MAAGTDRVIRALAGLQRRAEKPCIGADRQDIGIALDSAGERHEAPGAFAFRERLGAPGRRHATRVGNDPDLEQPRRLVLEVELGVLDARPGAHHLDVAGLGAAGVAETVPMGDRALRDVGYDLHVAMGMRGKPVLGGDLVVVPNPDRAPAHALGVMIAGEGKMMLGVEPAVVGGAKAIERSNVDHDALPRRMLLRLMRR